jgi:hypothetical protein
MFVVRALEITITVASSMCPTFEGAGIRVPVFVAPDKKTEGEGKNWPIE